MTSLPYESTTQPPTLAFADQRGGMKALGIVLIVLGGFIGCIGGMTLPMMLLASRYPAPTAPGRPPVAARPIARTSDLVMAVGTYAIAAGAMITVGVGSLKVRRWSRPAALILTGSWCLLGVQGVINFLVMAPGIRNAMNQAAAAAAPPGAPAPSAATTAPLIGLVFVVIFIALFGILLPTGLFLFYRRDAVRQTVDYFAPEPVWTDRAPVPVLAACCWLAVSAALSLILAQRGVLPVFGVLLTGPLAILAIFGIAILNAALAVGLFKLRPAAWWAALMLVGLGLASMLVTFARVDMYEMYRLSGTPPEQIEMMKQTGMNVRLTMLISSLLYGGVALGYLSWIGKYFSRAQADSVV